MGNPHLFTHLFHGGVILSSRRMDYDPDSEEDMVKSLMQSQHKAVLKDLKQGTFDDKIDSYLGNNPDLLPRSGASASKAAEGLPAPEVVPLTSTGLSDPGTEELSAAAVMAVSAPTKRAKTAAEVAEERELHAEEAFAKARDHIAESYKAESDTATAFSHAPILKPELGDPVVTFSSSPSSVEKNPLAVPVASPDSNDRSGAYAMRRPDQGGSSPIPRSRPGTRPVTERAKTSRPSSRVATQQVRSPLAGARAGGKSKNAETGRRRSSVVVSRPAVIIGAPPKTVGGERSRQSSTRKARNLFGKDLISEKSLDEVIMAYLSEDGTEDK